MVILIKNIMILHTLLKTGKYTPNTGYNRIRDMACGTKNSSIIKVNPVNNITKGKEYDKHKAEQLYNEWLRNMNGAGVKETPKDSAKNLDSLVNDVINIDMEDNMNNEDSSTNVQEFIDQNIEMIKTEVTEPLSNFISLTRDNDIDAQIDFELALVESGGVFPESVFRESVRRESVGLEKSISNLNIRTTPPNFASLLEEDTDIDTTNSFKEPTCTAAYTGIPHMPPPLESLKEGHGKEIGSSNYNSCAILQSEDQQLCSSVDSIYDPLQERLILENMNSNKNVHYYNNQYTADKQYTANNGKIFTLRNPTNTNTDVGSLSNLQESYRIEDGKIYIYKTISSNTNTRNKLDYENDSRHSVGVDAIHHQQQYLLKNRDDSQNNDSITTNVIQNNNDKQTSNSGITWLPVTQILMPITYVSKKSTHLPEPSAQCKLPELLPLEDFEDEEEDEADIRVGRFSFNRFKLKDKEDLIEDVLEKITIPTSRKGRGVRGPKNWEFLMRLLADPRANPMLIKWEDQESYTFRLVEPDIIMDIWNSKSKRAPVDYNSFARGLRYHYKRGALTLVREHQMVYGCGPIAINLLHKLMRRNAEKPNSSPSFFRPWI